MGTELTEIAERWKPKVDGNVWDLIDELLILSLNDDDTNFTQLALDLVLDAGMTITIGADQIKGNFFIKINEGTPEEISVSASPAVGFQSSDWYHLLVLLIKRKKK